MKKKRISNKNLLTLGICKYWIIELDNQVCHLNIYTQWVKTQVNLGRYQTFNHLLIFFRYQLFFG